MANLTNIFTDIANAIREKNGTTEVYKPENMATAISNINTGADVTAFWGAFSKNGERRQWRYCFSNSSIPEEFKDNSKMPVIEGFCDRMFYNTTMNDYSFIGPTAEKPLKIWAPDGTKGSNSAYVFSSNSSWYLPYISSYVWSKHTGWFYNAPVVSVNFVYKENPDKVADSQGLFRSIDFGDCALNYSSLDSILNALYNYTGDSLDLQNNAELSKIYYEPHIVRFNNRDKGYLGQLTSGDEPITNLNTKGWTVIFKDDDGNVPNGDLNDIDYDLVLRCPDNQYWAGYNEFIVTPGGCIYFPSLSAKEDWIANNRILWKSEADGTDTYQKWVDNESWRLDEINN